MTLTIGPHERGLVRVFSVSLSEAEANALSKDLPELASYLGVEQFNPDYVELFPLRDLDSLGLAGYLEQGNGIDAEALDADRRKLAALEGWVLIVYSAAFGGQPVTLAPHSALTLIGTYAEPGTDWTATETLTSDAAKGAAAPAKPKKPSDAAMSGRIASLALLVLFLLTALMIWVAG